jgi:hypothetical protein
MTICLEEAGSVLLSARFPPGDLFIYFIENGL